MARDKATIIASISRLRTAIESGVRSVSTDGVTTSFDSADAMRKTLGELQSELAVIDGGATAATIKPRVRGINLESAW